MENNFPALLNSQGTLTKAGIEQQVNTLVENVDNGHLNPLDALTKLKYIQNLVEAGQKAIKEAVVREIAKYSKQEKIVVHGATVEPFTTPRYDYEACGDPTWNRLNQEKKDRETFLKAVKAPMGICNDDTGGETITIHPPTKKISDAIKVTFPNGE